MHSVAITQKTRSADLLVECEPGRRRRLAFNKKNPPVQNLTSDPLVAENTPSTLSKYKKKYPVELIIKWLNASKYLRNDTNSGKKVREAFAIALTHGAVQKMVCGNRSFLY